MAVLVVGNEKSIKALDRRLFRTGTSEANLDRLRAALREANPDVDFDNLKPGVVLKIPRLPEFKAGGDLSFDESVSEAIGTARNELTADVKQLATLSTRRLRSRASERDRLAEMLSADEVKRFADQDESVRDALEAVAKSIEEDRGNDQVNQAVAKQAFSEWTEELAALDRLLP